MLDAGVALLVVALRHAVLVRCVLAHGRGAMVMLGAQSDRYRSKRAHRQQGQYQEHYHSFERAAPCA